MKRLRAHPPTHIAGQPVITVEDYLPGKDSLPPSDVLRFWLADGSKLVIRPSGTEPKVKIYAEVMQKEITNIDTAIASCDKRLQKMVENFQREYVE
jgi:phosphomannomutase